ncbi:MAG TPA: bifunctional UDP-N-acetylglucosamine diphosphorylase/glucosamine-1-phosphate N-acetyltransferase GlmU [Vicinamibacterales bacterium]
MSSSSHVSSDVHVVVLAAGKGTRMRSNRAKVLHEVAGSALIDHVLRVVEPLKPASVVVIIGHQAEEVRAAFSGRRDVSLAIQEPQLGTGHALLQAEPFLRGRDGSVLLLSGDVPLLRTKTVEALLARHTQAAAAATVVTAHFERPDGYGRIVRQDGAISAIVEHKDASPAERSITEINSGIYVFHLPPLFDALKQIGAGNAQREYYLPDLVRIYRTRGETVEGLVLDDPREILGVNSRKELADVAAILRDRKNEELMAAGVTVIDPATTWVQPDVVVGADTVLHPNVYLEGQTRIGSGCVIHSGVRIVDSTIGDTVVVNNFCVIRQSQVDTGAQIGPFAQIRPESHVGEGAHIGNFVELKKTRLGKGSKANHLAYLGDATIGERVNVGAGTITCNYDGVSKHPTIIDDGAFIGSDSQLIAPVRVGKGAYVAAGSSITEDVPEESLAIARSRQVNKPGWIARVKKKKT